MEESKTRRGGDSCTGALYMLPTKKDPWFPLTILVSLLKAFCIQEEEAHWKFVRPDLTEDLRSLQLRTTDSIKTPTSPSANERYFWVNFEAMKYKIHHGLFGHSLGLFCFHTSYPLILDHKGFVVILCPSFTGQRGEVAQGHSALVSRAERWAPLSGAGGMALCWTTVGLQWCPLLPKNE